MLSMPNNKGCRWAVLGLILGIFLTFDGSPELSSRLQAKAVFHETPSSVDGLASIDLNDELEVAVGSYSTNIPFLHYLVFVASSGSTHREFTQRPSFHTWKGRGPPSNQLA